MIKDKIYTEKEMQTVWEQFHKLENGQNIVLLMENMLNGSIS